MFGLVDRPFQKAIRPASNREVLHALLSYMKCVHTTFASWHCLPCEFGAGHPYSDCTGFAPNRNSYWARAVGCSPEPAFIEPLDSRTVTDMSWGMDWEEGNFNLKRALACAERQVHLMPSCQKTQLQYALLQYATG